MNDSGQRTFQSKMQETKRLKAIKPKHRKGKQRHPEVTIRKERIELERFLSEIWETST